MIRVRQKLNDQPEQLGILTEQEAVTLRLKYQFKLLLGGIRMIDVDNTGCQFRLLRESTNEIIGYLYFEETE